MQLSAGGTHVHHHGLLSGLGAGAVGVLAGFGLMLMAWRTVGRAVGIAGNVIVWALTAFVVAAAAYGVLFLVLRLRHHVAHPETLTRQSVRAEVIPAAVPAITEVQAVPVVKPAAALPPGTHHTWRLPNDPEAAIAVIRAIKAEGLAGVPSDTGELPR